MARASIYHRNKYGELFQITSVTGKLYKVGSRLGSLVITQFMGGYEGGDGYTRAMFRCDCGVRVILVFDKVARTDENGRDYNIGHGEFCRIWMETNTLFERKAREEKKARDREREANQRRALKERHEKIQEKFRANSRPVKKL